MKIVQATRAHAPEISRLMLLDLKSPNPRFPHSMMAQFRKHAKPDNVANEFDNDYLLAYIAVYQRHPASLLKSTVSPGSMVTSSSGAVMPTMFQPPADFV